MPESWITQHWPELLTLASVVGFAIRTQQTAAQSALAVTSLGAKLDRVSEATQTKISEIEKMLASIGPRQRDLDRMEREVEALWKRVDQMRVDVAAMKARDGAHGHQDLERESGPMPPRERDSNE